MDKIDFELAVTQIGDFYYLTPSQEKDWRRVVFKCTEITKFILQQMMVEISLSDLIQLVLEEFPDSSEDLSQITEDTYTTIHNLILQPNILEVVVV